METEKEKIIRLESEIRKLKDRCSRYWIAMRFYADQGTWEMHPRRFRIWGQSEYYCDAQEDAGKRARECSDPDTETVEPRYTSI